MFELNRTECYGNIAKGCGRRAVGRGGGWGWVGAYYGGGRVGGKGEVGGGRRGGGQWGDLTRYAIDTSGQAVDTRCLAGQVSYTIDLQL